MKKNDICLHCIQITLNVKNIHLDDDYRVTDIQYNYALETEHIVKLTYHHPKKKERKKKHLWLSRACVH